MKNGYSADRKVFGALNALRGVAAFCVMLFHAGDLLGLGVQPAPKGYLAVDLFFVLSGFVIAHAYDQRFADGLRSRRFLWMRLKRFYPLYAMGLLLSAGWLALETIASPPAFLTPEALAVVLLLGLLFLPAPLTADLYPLNPPSWSLFVELVVNFLYAATYRFLSTGRLLLLAGLAAVGLILSGDPLEGGAHLANAHEGFLRAAFSFPTGVIIYRRRDLFSGLRMPAAIPLSASVLLLVLPLPDLAVALVAFPVVVVLLARSGNNRFYEWLGAISFPLYAIHFPVIQVGNALKDRVPLAPWLLGLLTLAGAVLLAHFAERYLDQPLRERLKGVESNGPLRQHPSATAKLD